MKLSKDFSVVEFVPPAIHEQFADKSIWFIDPKIVQMAQFIRDRFGKPITINNYLCRFINHSPMASSLIRSFIARSMKSMKSKPQDGFEYWN